MKELREEVDFEGAEAFRVFMDAAPDAIVVVNGKGRMLMVNGLTESLFGYPRAEMLGSQVEVLVPERLRGDHVRYREGYFRNPRTRPMGVGRELSGKRKDGTEFPVEISLSPLRTRTGMMVISIVRDITDRRRAEERLEDSLRKMRSLLEEKEALLKEIHHRVKNNLQITSSLLRLQSDYLEDARARELFAESQNRIRSMALVHEKLYRATDLSKINFPEYVDGLARLLFQSYGVNKERIRIEVPKASVFLSIEAAVPCGLIVNELISNSLKHAFSPERPGRILVEVKAEKSGEAVISVSDDGRGLPSGFDIEKADSLGLQLVRSLVRQLNGRIEVRSSGGAWFRFSFPMSREPVHG